MKNFKSIAIFVFLGIGLSTMISCSSKGTKPAKDTVPVVFVTTSNPSGAIGDGINASGHIEAVETATISTKMMGYIIQLNVKVGDKVKAGQVLGTINNTEIMAKRAQTDAMITEAEANLSSASKDYGRFMKLYDQQSASAKELDNVTLQYNSAKARVEAAKQMRNEVRAMLSNTTLIAPFSGIVVQKLAEAGTLATPGMPLLILEKSGSFQVNASIPESQISQVKLNDKVKVTIKSTGVEFNGMVVEINPSSQFSGGQYIIKISVPDSEKKEMLAGMYVNIFIPGKGDSLKEISDNVVLVPQSAIVNKDQLKGLYTISANNTALLRWVRLGRVFGDEVEVISGLDKTESFILSSEGKLYNGAPVTVKN
jgi:RND family efflux transporter MFP subunit